MKSVSSAILVLAGSILISFSELAISTAILPRPELKLMGKVIGLIGLVGWVIAFCFEKNKASK
jgi:hypothetical protein